MISRRDLLRALALAGAGAALPRRARAGWEASQVGACLLDPGWDEQPRSRAFDDLMRVVGELTSVPVREGTPRLPFGDPALRADPLLALVGDRGFDAPDDAAVDALREQLHRGGLLLVDDASGVNHSDFARDAEALLVRLFPASELAPLPPEHAVFRSFFLLDGVAGRVMVRPYLEGIAVDDVTPVIVSRNDLCGAWMRAPGGGHAWDVIPGGEDQRTRAIELGVNLVMYALTANYKRDAVHVESLLRRMREEGRIP